MADDIELDVLVVGAGLVGASFAVALSQQNSALAVGLVEAHPHPDTHLGAQYDPRVVALTERSRKLLAKCGVWAQLVEHGVCPYTHMTVWDAEGTGRIEFDAAEIHAPSLGHIVENHPIVDALHQRVDESDAIQLFCPAKLDQVAVEDDVVRVTLTDGSAIRCKLLVAADGAVSRVRDRFEFATREWDYGHSAIVTTIKTELPHRATAWQRFMPTGPLALLPLHGGNDHYCSIVWSQQTAEAERLMALEDAAFMMELTRASEQQLGEVVTIDKRYSFPLRQRHATDYVKPRIALLGDSAHTIHPLAGQGVNLGFGDVETLVQEIERAVNRGLDIGSLGVLERYQRQRKPENLAMMAAMEGFKRLFATDEPALRLARNWGMSFLNQLHPIKQFLIQQARG